MNLQDVYSPCEELRALETIYALPDQNIRTVSNLFKDTRVRPSEALAKWSAATIEELREAVTAFIGKLTSRFSISLHGDFQYPRRLRSADDPAEMLYYRGDIGLLESPSVSVVGARKCSPEGAARARRLARGLVSSGFTVVSGLARGIDTEAMTAAIEAGGHTIGVIGTPIHEYYPKENRALQDDVAASHLLMSHVPMYRSSREPVTLRGRQYFPWRNQTMAALSEATVIVEASDTSGSLIQARSALKQGRKLFILDSCFDTGLAWPHTYAKRGAVRVRDFDDIFSALEKDDGGEALEED